jgi:hypothetical protein
MNGGSYGIGKIHATAPMLSQLDRAQFAHLFCSPCGGLLQAVSLEMETSFPLAIFSNNWRKSSNLIQAGLSGILTKNQDNPSSFWFQVVSPCRFR